MRAPALEALWDEYSARLGAFIRGKVEDASDAQDLVQEVFLRIHTGLCCREAVGRLDSWIYRVTRNLIVDRRRRKRPTVQLPEDLAADLGERPDDDPRSRLALSLRGAVEEPESPYREALLATEYEGLSQKQLAQRAGISLSGAKSRVQRAREKLRSLLLDCCHFELDRLGRMVDYHPRCGSCGPARTAGIAG